MQAVVCGHRLDVRALSLPDSWSKLGSLFRRRTQASSAWWWTPTSSCPSTQRKSLRCTRARSGTRCHPTSTPSPTRPTGACCKVSHLQRHRAPPPPGSPPGLLIVTHQAPPVLPACSSRQECGVWQAELGNRRAVTEKGEKQAEQMCVQPGRGGRGDSLGKYRHGLADPWLPKAWVDQPSGRWQDAVTLEGKRVGNGPGAEPTRSEFAASCHILWDPVQMSFPLQPQFPHLWKESERIHLAACCTDGKAGFPTLKTFVYYLHIYVVLLLLSLITSTAVEHTYRRMQKVHKFSVQSKINFYMPTVVITTQTKMGNNSRKFSHTSSHKWNTSSYKWIWPSVLTLEKGQQERALAVSKLCTVVMWFLGVKSLEVVSRQLVGWIQPSDKFGFWSTWSFKDTLISCQLLKMWSLYTKSPISRLFWKYWNIWQHVIPPVSPSKGHMSSPVPWPGPLVWVYCLAPVLDPGIASSKNVLLRIERSPVLQAPEARCT